MLLHRLEVCELGRRHARKSDLVHQCGRHSRIRGKALERAQLTEGQQPQQIDDGDPGRGSLVGNRLSNLPGYTRTVRHL